MKPTRALFLDKASLYPADLDFTRLENIAQWQWFDNASINGCFSGNSDINQQDLESVEILVSNKIRIDRRVIQSCKNLKLICVAATGVNNVDLDAAQDYGVTVCNVRAYATASVTQHVFSLILSLNRKLSVYKNSVINGSWSKSDYFCYFDEPISDLENKSLGIVGYGELGRAIEKVALSFGMQVLVAESHDNSQRNKKSGNIKTEDKTPEIGVRGVEQQEGEQQEPEQRVSLNTLLTQSDVVSLHCPLTPDNLHMIAQRELSLMKQSAIIINTARGGLIDETALSSALENNEIAAAGLDVLEQEPPENNSPLINFARENENLIITPHIAWASQQARQHLVNEIAENIRAYQAGTLRNVIV